MAVLFLDPLALALLLGLLVYVWVVWRGTFRRWFGRDEGWTVLAWPIPLLAIGVPPLAGSLLWVVGRLGFGVGGGDIADAVLYAAVYLAPAAAVAIWPPRWLLPGWARRRLAELPRDGDPAGPEGAIPAVQASRGHGSRARWVWLVDGVAGQAWLDGKTLRFRSASVPDTHLDIDEEMVAELRFADDGELHLASPRGGWWSRGHLDLELDEVDRVRFQEVRPWRRDGLLTVEVTGRRPVQLWLGDVRRLQRALVEVGEDPAAGRDIERGEPR